MSDFNNPAPCSKVWIVFDQQFFFTSRTDMRNILSGYDFIFVPNISRVKTKVLRIFGRWLRTVYNDIVKCFTEQFYIMRVRSGYYDRYGKPVSLG